MGSMTWVRMKPSMLTMMGRQTLLSSATLKAWMVRSRTSWPFSAKVWIQPTSFSVMMSL